MQGVIEGIYNLGISRREKKVVVKYSTRIEHIVVGQNIAALYKQVVRIIHCRFVQPHLPQCGIVWRNESLSNEDEIVEQIKCEIDLKEFRINSDRSHDSTFPAYFNCVVTDFCKSI